MAIVYVCECGKTFRAKDSGPELAPGDEVNVPRRLAIRNTLLIVLVLAAGIALRVRSYQKQAGLTRDEAALAANIIQRDVRGLFKPLGKDQAAPIGHLLLVKLATRSLGNTEAALRLPALLAAIMTLVVYVLLARQCVSPHSQVLGLALMAFSWPLVEYSLSVKQYSGDVLATVSLLVVVFWVLRRPASGMRYILLGIAGITAIWFSHPSVFVLAGIGLTLFAEAVLRKRPREALNWVAVSGVWLATFLVAYAMVYRDYASNNDLTSFWTANFAPFPPRSVADIKWYYDSFLALFWCPLGIKFVGLAGACYLFGAYLLARGIDRRVVGILIAPLVVTLAAAVLKKYPFSNRLMLFACPLLATLTAVGGTAIGYAAREGGRVVRGIVVTLLLAFPVFIGLKTMISGPYLLHDIKPALAYVAEHWRDDDVVYLNYGADTLHDYYVNLLNYRGLHGKPFVRGRYAGDGTSVDEQVKIYGEDVEPLRGKKRVWFVFAMDREVQEPLFTYLLDRRGVRHDAYHGRRSTALLYDLSGAAAAGL
jgi:hypothetical protein